MSVCVLHLVGTTEGSVTSVSLLLPPFLVFLELFKEQKLDGFEEKLDPSRK